MKALRDYAFVADGRRGALVDTEGAMAWLCFPDWADPALFASLIGSAGEYQLRPRGAHVPGGHYEEGTLIWRNRWVTQDGILECRDALAYPGDPDRAIVLRSLRALDAPCRVEVDLHLALDYGRRAVRGWTQEDGVWTTPPGPVAARWRGAPEAVCDPDGNLHAEVSVAPEQSRELVLELMVGDPANYQPPDAASVWSRTEAAWRIDVPACNGLVARDDVRRSFAVLRGMTMQGATVAAATTSLPERAEAGRNYDYRYCWMRDTCYVGNAAAVVEHAEPLLDGAVGWVTARLLDEGDRTAPAHRTDGSPIPNEERLNLPGYPGGSDVVGNRAGDQLQLDLFGESLVLLARAADLGRLDAEGWRAAEVAASAIELRWGEPEAGVWEIEPEHWTHSRLICVAGLRALARAGGPASVTSRALGLADAILSETDRTSLHSSGRWQRSPSDTRVDASLLLMEIRDGLAADDPRSVATRAAVANELAEDGFVYRYADRIDDLGAAEGAFLICNFWMALAHAGAGKPLEAARWFERGRSAAGPSGLLAEEFDVRQRQLRGNIPQAFVHALLIESAASQARGEESW